MLKVSPEHSAKNIGGIIKRPAKLVSSCFLALEIMVTSFWLPFIVPRRAVRFTRKTCFVAPKFFAQSFHEKRLCTVDFSTIFVSLSNMKRSFHESQNWYFAEANWWFGIKTDQLMQRKQRKRSFLMLNHNLPFSKYQFRDSWNERLMFRSKTEMVEEFTVYDSNLWCLISMGKLFSGQRQYRFPRLRTSI